MKHLKNSIYFTNFLTFLQDWSSSQILANNILIHKLCFLHQRLCKQCEHIHIIIRISSRIFQLIEHGSNIYRYLTTPGHQLHEHCNQHLYKSPLTTICNHLCGWFGLNPLRPASDWSGIKSIIFWYVLALRAFFGWTGPTWWGPGPSKNSCWMACIKVQFE